MDKFKKNLTFIIVTYRSQNVIHRCIKSIDSKIKIVVVENSNNFFINNVLTLCSLAILCSGFHPIPFGITAPFRMIKNNIILTQNERVFERRSLRGFRFFGDSYPMQQTAVSFIAARGSMNQTAVIPHQQHIG